MVTTLDEDSLINETALFGTLIKSQLCQIIKDGKRFSDRSEELKSSYAKLQTLLNSAQNLSIKRDPYVTKPSYAKIVTAILQIIDGMTEIAVLYDLIDFDDSTRFGSYKGGFVDAA